MPIRQPKRRNALNATMPDSRANDKQILGSPLDTKPQLSAPTTPRIPSAPPLDPLDTLTLGDYVVSVDTFLAHGLKLEDHFVEIYQATARRISGDGYKGQKTCTLRKIPFASSALKKACEAEERILRELTRSKHPNINPLLDFAAMDRSTPMNPECWDIFYLFSDLEIANLSTMIADHRKNKTRMAEDQIIRIAIDLVDTLAFLHDCTPPLLHRHIRPSSIVQTSFRTFKISGFLSSAFPMVSASSWEVDQLVKLDIGCYTDPRYRSPEMTKIHDYRRRDAAVYTAASDIWCVGILLYTMCYKRHPFEEKDGGSILEARIPEHSWTTYPRVKPFIDQIFKKEPQARPTAKALQISLRNVLEHPLYTSYEIPPVIFSLEARELLTIPREPFKLSGDIGRETPFLDPSRSRPLPTEFHPTAGSIRKGCVSSQTGGPGDDQEKAGRSHPDRHTSSLCPPVFSSFNRSKSASPRLPTTGLNQVEFPDRKDGSTNVPLISISASDEAPPYDNRLGLLTSASFVGFPAGHGHLRRLQSAELRREPSQSVQRSTRSPSAGSQPRPNPPKLKIDEIPYGGHDLADGRPGHSQGSSPLEICLIGKDKPGSEIHMSDAAESQEQDEQAENPSIDDDIGHLVTITSREAVYVNGRFGDVFEGIHKTMGKVALKRPRVGRTTAEEKDVIRRFEREGRTWRRLNHPHILKFLGTFKRETHIYFVSPFIDNGTLLEYIREHPNIHRIRLLRETADAINYLHKTRIVHGDIKASNILIDSGEHVLLCDFGLTKTFSSHTSTAMKRAGTVRWQSPELWDNESKTFKSDVYAFAMTIVEVLTGVPPFSHMQHETAVLLAVYGNDERPEKTPMDFNGISYENAWEVAEACWQKMPRDRITISEAFNRLRADASLV